MPRSKDSIRRTLFLRLLPEALQVSEAAAPCHGASRSWPRPLGLQPGGRGQGKTEAARIVRYRPHEKSFHCKRSLHMVGSG